ncbi:glycosyltransferase family 4 protein [Chloroflexia bacterium SDU3-3]|nr:glycosyltransferase family 4 protein [Chloroflexia bacterium SDU3-3]
MIIGIDYTAALHQGAGIGRYTRDLIGAVLEQGPQHQYRLFYAAGGLDAGGPYMAELARLCRRPGVRAAPIPLSPRRLTQLWQRLRAPLPVELFTGRLDVLHAPDFVLPPTFARTLLTVHDLSFLVHPELTVPSMVRYLSGAVPRSARRADHILADSLATQRDITSLLGAPESRMSVVYPGLAAGFGPRPAEECAEVRARLGLPERFLVFVSTLSPRKNVERLVDAFAQVVSQGRVAPDLALILIGSRGWMDEGIFAAIERAGLGERIRWLRYVGDNDLPAVYNLASAMVYPSIYEGFGLPALEALACGTPVLTADNSSLPEVVGDAAVLVDAMSVPSIAGGIERLMNDSALRARLAAQGPAQARRFTWDHAAQQVLACYEQLAQQRR